MSEYLFDDFNLNKKHLIRRRIYKELLKICVLSRLSATSGICPFYSSSLASSRSLLFLYGTCYDAIISRPSCHLVALLLLWATKFLGGSLSISLKQGVPKENGRKNFSIVILFRSDDVKRKIAEPKKISMKNGIK